MSAGIEAGRVAPTQRWRPDRAVDGTTSDGRPNMEGARTNSDRAKTAEQALWHAAVYRFRNSSLPYLTGNDRGILDDDLDEDSVMHLLTDIRHYCTRKGIDFDTASDYSRQNWEFER